MVSLLASIGFVFLIFTLPPLLAEIVIDGGQPRVDTEYGTVFGTVELLKSKKEVFSFRSIPYAQPPVGNLRFEKPQKMTHFGTVNSTEYGPNCLFFKKKQSETTTTGQEDCLFLNIVVPKSHSTPTALTRAPSNPVMVLFLGGGYVTSNASKYHTDHFYEYFVTRGIVYVTLQFRTGPLGYYSDTQKSSNVALYDKIEALRFVQEIISEFYGDPRRVTIFGLSAGALELSLLTFSHLSKGLYKQTIHLCGNGQTTAIQANGNVKTSRKLEQDMGCAAAKDKMKCLKSKNVYEIWEKSVSDYQVVSDNLEGTNYAATFYDRDLLPAATFEENLKLTDATASFYGINMLEDTIGAVESNVAPGTKYAPLTPSQLYNYSIDEMSSSIAHLLTKERGKPDKNIQKIVNFYRTQGSENPPFQAAQAFVQFFTDMHYGVGAIREAKLKAKHGNRVYFYHNKFRIENYPQLEPPLIGTTHCFEGPLIFGDWASLPPPEETGEYLKVMQAYVEMLVHFVKHGIPKLNGTSLPLVTAYRVPYAVVDYEFSFGKNFWHDRAAFWESTVANSGFDWITGSEAFI